MIDTNIELRLNNFQKCKFDLSNLREKTNFSLRKRNIEEVINNKRYTKQKNFDNTVYEIDIVRLEIPNLAQIKEKAVNFKLIFFKI